MSCQSRTLLFLRSNRYERWTMKKAEHWRIDAFELWCWRRLLRAPWTARRSNQSILKDISPRSDQSFIGRTDAKAETPIHWPPDVESWLTWKDPDAGKDWGWKENGTTEDEMVGWHYWHNGHGFEWTSGVGDGQGGPACCSSWGCKEWDTTEQLNWTDRSSLPWMTVFSILTSWIKVIHLFQLLIVNEPILMLLLMKHFLH